MAGQQTRVLLRMLVDGIPLMTEVEEYTSARPKKKMEEVKGGGFIAGDIFTGIEKMTGSIVVKGTPIDVLAKYGLTGGNKVPVTIKESLRDEDGKRTTVVETWIAEMTDAEESGKGQGQLGQHTLNFSCDSSKRTENGKVLWNVSRRAHICDLGNGDLLEADRAAIGI